MDSRMVCAAGGILTSSWITATGAQIEDEK
jgi:hypothetical protein